MIAEIIFCLFALLFELIGGLLGLIVNCAFFLASCVFEIAVEIIDSNVAKVVIFIVLVFGGLIGGAWYWGGQ